MAFKISRRLWVLGRPCPLGAGRWGSMYFHSASEISVGYLFLMRARVAKQPPRTTFHTVSPRRWVNSIEMRCRMGLRLDGAVFAVSVGFLLDALVGHGEIGLPGRTVVVGHLPG